jgi:uncharacterized protein (DUF486 family)
MEIYLVPLMLLASSVLMAFAWIGHVKYRNKSFFVALIFSWLLVLPEYLLNVSAIRWGVGTFQPSEMAAINLATGVVCIALVSKVYLGENLSSRKIFGFVLMIISVAFVVL